MWRGAFHRGGGVNTSRGAAHITSRLIAGCFDLPDRTAMFVVMSHLQENLIQTLCCCLRARVLHASDCIEASTPLQTEASDGRQPCYTPVLDELALEHMSQDCSSLKKQLLRLKMLLQV